MGSAAFLPQRIAEVGNIRGTGHGMEDHSLLFWARPLRETPIPSGSAGPGPIFLSPRVRGDLFAVANPRLGREATAWSIGSPLVHGGSSGWNRPASALVERCQLGRDSVANDVGYGDGTEPEEKEGIYQGAGQRQVRPCGQPTREHRPYREDP